MPPNFDVQGARTAGYKDSEIADILAQKAGFDANSARTAGHADADIINHLMSSPKMLDRAPVVSENQKAQKDLAESTGTGEALLIGAGRTFDRVGKGMQQGWYALTGNEKEQAALKQRAADEDALYKPLQDAHPIATSVGESLPSMAVPVGGVGATAIGSAAKLATAAAVPSFLEHGSVEERTKRATGAAAGAAIGGVLIPKVVGTTLNAGKSAIKGLAGNITAEALALAKRAEALGIPVNIAQLGDSKFLKTLASSIEQMPFTGGAKTAEAQRTAYTNAVGKTFGADVERVTPEIYNFHKKRLGAQFDTLAARNDLDITPQLTSKITSIVDQAGATANDDTIRAMNNIASRVTNQSQGGKLAGDTYSSIDSELVNIIKGGGEKGLYAKRMQTAIRDAMDTSISPADQALWTETRSQYKNLKAVRDIVARDAANGQVPPNQLMSALNNTEAGKEAMAMGTRGTLGELGQIGKQFVRDQVPNSGTAQRAIAMGLIGGGGYAFGAEPTTIAGMVAGSATAGRLLNKILTDPKNIERLTQQGISLSDLSKLPPDKITQILGGLTGMSVSNRMEGQ